MCSDHLAQKPQMHAQCSYCIYVLTIPLVSPTSVVYYGSQQFGDWGIKNNP